MIDAIVWSNIVFTAGAVVLAVVIGIVVALRHRTPKTVEATVDSFSRGLQALSPEGRSNRRGRRRPAPASEPAPLPAQSVRTTYPARGRAGGPTREAETG